MLHSARKSIRFAALLLLCAAAFFCAVLPAGAASSAPASAPASSAAPASSGRAVSLPPVESVRERQVIAAPQSDPVRDRAVNAVGALLWAGAAGGITAILLAARRYRRRHALPADSLGRRRYRAVRRDRRRRLLGDKYYHDSKYHKKL